MDDNLESFEANRQQSYMEIGNIYRHISTSDYQLAVENFESEIKDYLRGKLNEAIFKVTGVEVNGRVGIKVSSIGSTARLTNVPENSDFDVEIAIFVNQLEKLISIHLNQIINLFVLEIHKEGFLGNCIIRRYSDDKIESLLLETVTPAQLVDFIDVGKVDIQIHTQYDFAKDKRTAPQMIRKLMLGLCKNPDKTINHEKLNELRAKIIFTKKLLYENSCYKFNSSGKRIGIGGVGVECWIIQHMGNIEEAFKAFWNSSFDSDGNLVEFEEFKANYSIFGNFTNPNGNSKPHFFTDKILKKEGWLGMLRAIESTGLHL